MSSKYSIQEAYNSIYTTEGIASEHPDIKDQEEFSKKADKILAARRQKRFKERGPELPSFVKKYKKIKEEHDGLEFRSRTVTDPLFSDNSSDDKEKSTTASFLRKMRELGMSSGEIKKKKKKKKEKYNLGEETMTPEQKQKESKLKDKYDDSEMKQNMIDQYGKEEGTQIYFAKIRKMAMEEVGEIDEQNAGPSTPVKYDPHMKQMVPNQGAGRPTNIRLKNKPSSGVGVQMAHYESGKETLEERKLSRTAKRSARAGKPGYDAEGRPKPKGKVRAWDMDETLMRNDPKKIRVHVKDKEGKRVQSLTNQEFNTHKLDKDKGHSYDFDEFRSSEKFSKASTPNKSMVKKLKKQVRRGKPVHIVTARGSFDDQPKFAKHLRRHGIEIDKGKGKGGRNVHVHRAGDMPGSDIGQKKVDIVKGLMKKHGTSGAEMYDDAAKVHRAFKKSAKENPTQPKVKTKMVQPDKKNVTQSRSFREEIDLNFIYDCILEQLIAEGFASDYEDASILVEGFNDDLISDLIEEVVNALQEIEEVEEMTEETATRINYISPYKKLQEKKEILEKYLGEESDNDLTPYDYWKTFIGESDIEFVSDVSEDVDPIEYDNNSHDTPMTSYEYWKIRIQEQSRPVGREAMVSANIARAKAAKEKRIESRASAKDAADSVKKAASSSLSSNTTKSTPTSVSSTLSTTPSPIAPGTTSKGPVVTSATKAGSTPTSVSGEIASTPSPIQPFRKAKTGFGGIGQTPLTSEKSRPRVVQSSTLRPRTKPLW
jgi:hypothetical protein